ncbi:MAG: hypothetical protein ACXAC7_16415 [Candidatus Hodarchaeales archaeon]|jgi:hypothetical protein
MENVFNVIWIKPKFLVLLGGMIQRIIKKSKLDFNGKIIDSKFPSASSANSYVKQGGSDFILREIVENLIE